MFESFAYGVVHLHLCMLFCAEQGGGGGGGGASVGAVTDAGKGPKFFCKTAGASAASMLKAEYLGLKEMANTHTIKVPAPICAGEAAGQSYAVFEFLNMGRSSKAKYTETGEQLARMHLCTSPNGKFGFHVDNTIGATPQPNTWTDTWPEFWDEHRLGHMLKLCARSGATYGKDKEVRAKVKQILSTCKVQPALVHGDLWTGNAGFTVDGDGVIFDPGKFFLIMFLLSVIYVCFVEYSVAFWPFTQCSICDLQQF
jgi:fructosamine-3-kinase